jgi:hypothetical protein
MHEPRFTAESSLYRTSACYRTADTAARAIGAIQPAEIIEVHGCAPGTDIVEWDDGTWSCEPVGPNPWGGGGGSGGPGTVEERDGNDGPPRGGEGKRPPSKPPRKPKRWPPRLGRDCEAKDIPGGDVMSAIIECGGKAKEGELRNLRCFDNPDGTTDVVCCHENSKTHHQICISDVQEVPK